MSKRDYYEVLGINKGASDDEIKKAYRKAAMKYHPDKFSNATEQEKKDAEEKFKEVNEAYQVLSDAQKKAQYDQFGHAAFEQGGGFGGGGFGGFGGSGFEDIFSSFFGGGGGFSGFGGSSRRSYREPGADLRYSIEITLEEAAKGVEKTIKYKRNGKCKSCDGTGAETGSSLKTCSKCNGNGFIRTVQRTMFGNMATESECPDCHGKGKTPEKKCKHCHGTGIEKETVEKKISIPAGIDNGQKLRLSGMGEASSNGGENGDLYVVIKIKQHQIFERDGEDIHCEIPIKFTTAVLGGEIEVPTLNGKKSIKIPAGTQTGKVFKLRGEGIKSLRGGYTGDEYIKITIETPTDLNSEQQELLMKFEESLKEKNYKHHTTFWEKLKKIFHN